MFSLTPLTTTILTSGFTFLMTSLGAALIFAIKDQPHKRLMQISLGFAAGIMIAASIWKSINSSHESGRKSRHK